MRTFATVTGLVAVASAAQLTTSDVAGHDGGLESIVAAVENISAGADHDDKIAAIAAPEN